MTKQNPNPQPIDAAVVPRFAGVATFMRLPTGESAKGLDIALTGIPWDGGTKNRAAPRHGPREIRSQSSLMRRVHHVSGTEPFSIARIADVGDVSVNPINLQDALKRIEEGIRSIVKHGALPLIAGGDHLTTLPVLRAVAKDMPKKTQMRFAPNTGYAFAVGDDTWHSADPVHNRVKTRDSILLTYFVDQGLLRILRNRGKRLGNFVLNEIRFRI